MHRKLRSCDDELLDWNMWFENEERKKERGGHNIFVHILVFSNMIHLLCLHWKILSKIRGGVVLV